MPRLVAGLRCPMHMHEINRLTHLKLVHVRQVLPLLLLRIITRRCTAASRAADSLGGLRCP